MLLHQNWAWPPDQDSRRSVYMLQQATTLITVNYLCQQQLWALRPVTPVPQRHSSQIDGKRLNAVAQANIETSRETKAKSHGLVALVTTVKQKNHLLLVGTPLTQMDKF